MRAVWSGIEAGGGGEAVWTHTQSLLPRNSGFVGRSCCADYRVVGAEAGQSLAYLPTWRGRRRLLSDRGRLGPARPTTIRTRQLMYSERGFSGVTDIRECSGPDARLTTVS